jgi:hypothetical protein
MKHLDLIFLPFFFLSLLVLFLAILAWAKFRKLEKPCDDFPGRYEDTERPFIKLY